MKLSCGKCMRLGRTLWTVSAVALLFSVPAFASQSQSNQKESLGEAARKARQQKKPAAKPAKVLTDEDLARPPTASAPSVQNAQASEARIPGETPAAGEPGQAAPGEPAPREASTPSPPETNEQRLAKLEGALKSAKEQLAEADKQLNLLQREFDLRRDSYYSNPDFKSDKQGKAQLDSLQQQISAGQQEVERLKQKVASLEAERKSLPAAPPPPAQEKPVAPPQP